MDEDQEIKSIQALNYFKEAVRDKKEYGYDGFTFEGLVTYFVRGTSVTEILEVALIVGGFEPMIKLDIYSKGRIITSAKYHLDFNPKFSQNTKFSFDPKNSVFTITGTNSSKLGNYSLTIREV